MEHIAGCDVFLGGVDGGFEFIAAAVGAHSGKLFASRVPGQWFDGGQRCVHPLAQGLDPSDGGLPGLLLIRPVGEVAEGDGGDLSFHLIKDQDRVHQHPDPIRGIGRNTGVDCDGGFDPLDQFVAPNAVQLSQGREARQVDAGVRREAVAQGFERVTAELLFTTVTPGARQTIVPRRRRPERIAGNHTPTPEGFTTFDRFQQHAWRPSVAHLDPGGEGCFKICGPTLSQRNQVGTTANSLMKGVAIGTEHDLIIAAETRRS